jgi:hypothetical protein
LAAATSSPTNPRPRRDEVARIPIPAAVHCVIIGFHAKRLAALYDPLVMLPELVKAHARLDALVDKAYGRSFSSDADRVAHLFRLYAKCANLGQT